MKLHSGWLAAGLLLAVVLACNTSRNGNNSNSNNSNNSNKSSNSSSNTRPANADVYVEQISMAKDDDGKPGESTTTFEASDSKIHCIINLNKAKAGTHVRTVWVAADVEGGKNQELKSLDYTTNSFEKKVSGYLTWSGEWPKGQYRLDVYINGALDKTVPYTVE